MRTLRRQLTRSDVASQLEAEVISGGLEAGTKLPSERELAVRLGVSRPLVREALRSLVERGLVEISPGRGAFVRAASTAEAVRPLGSHYLRQKITPHHLIEVRTVLEPAAARLAADPGHATQEIAALGHAVEQVERGRRASSTARAGTSRCTPSSPGCPTTRSSRRRSSRSRRSSSSSCSAARSDPKVDRRLRAVPPGGLRGDSRPRPGRRARARCAPTTRAGSRLLRGATSTRASTPSHAASSSASSGRRASLEQSVARGGASPRTAAARAPRARRSRGVEAPPRTAAISPQEARLARRASSSSSDAPASDVRRPGAASRNPTIAPATAGSASAQAIATAPGGRAACARPISAEPISASARLRRELRRRWKRGCACDASRLPAGAAIRSRVIAPVSMPEPHRGVDEHADARAASQNGQHRLLRLARDRASRVAAASRPVRSLQIAAELLDVEVGHADVARRVPRPCSSASVAQPSSMSSSGNRLVELVQVDRVEAAAARGSPRARAGASPAVSVRRRSGPRASTDARCPCVKTNGRSRDARRARRRRRDSERPMSVDRRRVDPVDAALERSPDRGGRVAVLD